MYIIFLKRPSLTESSPEIEEDRSIPELMSQIKEKHKYLWPFSDDVESDPNSDGKRRPGTECHHDS